VIAVPGGRSGQREVRHGPHAEAKWLTGSVARDAGEVIAAAFGQAESRDPAHARPWVALVDGGRHQIELNALLLPFTVDGLIWAASMVGRTGFEPVTSSVSGKCRPMWGSPAQSGWVER
jgi:hypothetical protein